jgi:hypothetical protein
MTSARPSDAMPRRTRTSAMDEIESVVASGKEVTIHEAPISKHRFSGSGYISIDPQTGAGGYVIEGGARGGIISENTREKGGIAMTALVMGVVDMLIPPANAATADEKEASKAVLSLMLDFFGALLTDLMGPLALVVKEIIAYLLGLEELFTKCAGAQLFLVGYMFAIVSVATVLIGFVLIAGGVSFIAAAAIGALLNSLIGLLVIPPIAETVCAKK